MTEADHKNALLRLANDPAAAIELAAAARWAVSRIAVADAAEREGVANAARRHAMDRLLTACRLETMVRASRLGVQIERETLRRMAPIRRSNRKIRKA